jgi:4-amino-4-deoxy-L-arabinose transferase-like glycosyltransferase
MFEGVSTKISRKYFIFLFVFAAANILLICSLFSRFGAKFGSDSEEYLTTAKYFAGQGALVNNDMVKLFGRLLKPVFPLSVGILSPLFGFRAPFIIINIIFYLAIGFFVFKIVKLLFNNERQALAASMLFLTAYPMLEYGINYYTDLAGWFFFVLSVYLTLLFGQKPSYRLVVWNGIISAIGFLTKESGGVGTLFFVLFLFFIYKDSFINKLKYLLTIAVVFWLPVVLWQVFVYFKYNYSYVDWFALSRRGDEIFRQDYFKIIPKSLAATFFLGWSFVLLGLVRIGKATPEVKKVVLALVLPSFSFLIWFGASSRIFYIIGLLLSILAGWGFVYLINNYRKTYAYSLLAMAIAGNYFWFVFDDRLRFLINAFLNIRY